MKINKCYHDGYRKIEKSLQILAPRLICRIIKISGKHLNNDQDQIDTDLHIHLCKKKCCYNEGQYEDDAGASRLSGR